MEVVDADFERFERAWSDGIGEGLELGEFFREPFEGSGDDSHVFEFAEVVHEGRFSGEIVEVASEVFAAGSSTQVLCLPAEELLERIVRAVDHPKETSAVIA